MCGVGCVEKEKFHDVLRIVLGLKDAYLSDASLLPRGHTAGEALKPRAEVGDLVFDVQDGHAPSVTRVQRLRCLP